MPYSNPNFKDRYPIRTNLIAVLSRDTLYRCMADVSQIVHDGVCEKCVFARNAVGIVDLARNAQERRGRSVVYLPPKLRSPIDQGPCLSIKSLRYVITNANTTQ